MSEIFINNFSCSLLQVEGAPKRERILRVEEEEEDIVEGDAAVDDVDDQEDKGDDSDSSGDHEMEFMESH